MPYKSLKKQKEVQKRYYKENKAVYINRNQERRKKRKEWFEEITKNDKCLFCNEKEKCCLDYHHVNPQEKDDEVKKMLNEFRSKKKVLKELEKCICVCANCHRKIHAGILIIPG